MADPTPIPPVDPVPVKPPRNYEVWRKVAGHLITLAVVITAVALILWVWDTVEQHPRTDDATVQANVIGVTPRVRGQIIKLNVQDNQSVKAGDVLFEIDPSDYQLALENAQAALGALDQEITVARSQDEDLKYQVKAAEAGYAQAKAELQRANDLVARLQPLVPKGYATVDDLDKAQTSVQVATAALAAQEQHSNQAKTALSSLATLQAQRPEAVAAVDQAKLNLSYCTVTAPFPGRVVNLHISIGAYASIGVPVFALLDTRQWYVVANFREGEIRHFAPGATVEVYLLSAPKHHFSGTVQGIGWAVASKDEIDISQGVPSVPRELNWVHIAQRFPVRIAIENPDPDLFRMGASAVAIIKSAPISE
jgi:multidrug efflux system membrane fusion protein